MKLNLKITEIRAAVESSHRLKWRKILRRVQEIFFIRRKKRLVEKIFSPFSWITYESVLLSVAEWNSKPKRIYNQNKKNNYKWQSIETIVHSFLYFTPRIFSVYTKIFIFSSLTCETWVKSKMFKPAHLINELILQCCQVAVKQKTKKYKRDQANYSFLWRSYCSFVVSVIFLYQSDWILWHLDSNDCSFKFCWSFKKKFFLTLKKHEYNFEAIGVLNNFLINIGIPRHKMIVNIYMKIMKAYH